MKTTKRLLALLMALTLLLSSLSPAAAAAELPEASVSAAEDTVIELWTYPVGSWTNADKVSELIAGFEAANPGITVNVEYLNYMNGDSTVNDAIENGTTPDLILEGPERLVADWGEMGVMADLSDLLDEDDMASIYPAALDACYGRDGNLYQYPLAGTVHTMAINKTVFEAAGAMQYLDEESHTWNSTEDFFKAVQAVYEYTGQQVGAVYCGGQGGDQGTRALVNNLYGGTFTNAEHTAYTWDSAENIAALQALYDCEGISYDGGFVGGDEIALLYYGCLNMAFCWNIAQQLNPNTADTGVGLTEDGDEILCMTFPSDDTPRLCGGIWGFGAFDNGDARRLEAAKRFIRYMCDSDAAADAIRATGYFPLRDDVDVWTDDAVLSEYGKLMPLLGDYYVVTPNWGYARTCWWQMLQAIEAGEDVASAVAYWNGEANGTNMTQIRVLAPAYSDYTFEYWTQFEQDYEQAYPDVDLVIDCVGWDEIYSLLDEGYTPDILNIDTYEEFLGRLLPVDAYLSEEVQSKIYPAFLAQSEMDGTVWAAPDLASARGLYVNTDILNEIGAEIPTNWAELLDVCAAIDAHYGDDVIPFGLDLSGNEGYLAFALAAWNAGGGFVDENGEWALNSDANVEAVEFLRTLYVNGYTNNIYTSRYELMDMFQAGTVAMTVAPSGWNPGNAFEIAAIPTETGTAHTMGVMDRIMCFDNGYSDAELAAITAFFDMFYEDARYAGWVFEEGFLPVTSTGMELFAGEHSFLASWAEILPNSKFYPSGKPGWGDVRNGVITVLEEALNGGDARELLDRLQEQVTSGGGWEEDDHAPFLSFCWLDNWGDGWRQNEDWRNDEGHWGFGYSHDLDFLPGDDFWQVYYLNVWNEEIQSYESSPVHVDFSHQLAGELLIDGEHDIYADAENHEYYYRVQVLEDTWDQTGTISYTMDDGTVVSLNVNIKRGEAGFYSSADICNKTYIREFRYDRINTDGNVFYFAFESDYWTLDAVDVQLSYMDFPGYELTDVITMEQVSGNIYKITLTPWVSSTGCGFELLFQLYLTDPDGNSNNGDWYQYIWCDDGDWVSPDASIRINNMYYLFYRTADGETAAYREIFVGDEEDGYWQMARVDLPEGVSYDLDTNTLTLNNASLDELSLSFAGEDWQNLPNGDVTIELMGENTISCNYTHAVTFNDNVNVTITGDGSLSIYAENSPQTDENGNYYSYSTVNMFSNANLTIAGNAAVTVEIAGEALETCWDGDTWLGDRSAQVAAIEGGMGTLTLKDNASLTTIVPEGARNNGPTVENEEDAIWGDWNPGGYRGIRGMGHFIIEGGTLNTQDIDLGTCWGENGMEWVGSFTQSGGTVNIKSLGSYGQTEKWEWDEEAQEDVYLGIVDHYHYNGLSSWDGGSITISGGELNIDCRQTQEELASSAWAHGIELGNNGELAISGGTVNVETNCGIAVNVSNLTVHGGILNARSGDGAGISAEAITVTDGLLDVNCGNGSCIEVRNSFTVSGGRINMEGRNGDTLNLTDADMVITGGTVAITGYDCQLVRIGGWEDYGDDSQDGTLTMTGGELILNAENAHNGNMEIRSRGRVLISGDARVEMNGGWLDTRGSLTIDGNASLELTNTQVGIHENGVMTIDGGSVTVDSVWNDTLEENCMFIERGSQLVVNGGSLTIDADNYCKGIMSMGTFLMDGGEVTVTLTGDRIGYAYHEEYDDYIYCAGFAFSSGGITTINGGTLSLTGHEALELFYSDWEDWNPDSRNTKFTFNGGTLNLEGEFAGLEAHAPAEINGGVINVHSTGMYIPFTESGVGYGILVRYNGYDDPQIASALTINGGEFNLVSDVKDNYSAFAMTANYAPLTINGGTIRATGGIALYDYGYEPGLVIADHLSLISVTDGSAKELLGRYVEDHYFDPDGNEIFETVWVATVEEDNQPGDMFTGEGLDHCTDLLISANTCGDELTWRVEDGVLTISGSGSMEDYSADAPAPWYALRGHITAVTVEAGVNGIGSYAFSGCYALKQIRFLGNAPTIGSNAFLGVTATASCYAYAKGWTSDVKRSYGGVISWKSINTLASGWSGDVQWRLTDDGVLRVYGQGNMKNYANKTAMPWYSYADQILSVVIDEGVTRIGDNAFYGMPRMTSIEIADTVTVIGEYAFKGCSELAQVALPNGLTKLGESAFYECTALTAIEIPASLWTIQPYTFKNCTALTEVIFHEGNLQKISDGAFYGTALKEVTFPDCLGILDVYSFKNCGDLETINLGSGLTELREAVFYGTAIPDITIPEGITKIGPYAFKNCVSLRDVSLPTTLKSVGEASFYACTGLQSLVLPDAVTSIGNYAFRRCTALETVIFSDSLVTIGESSFYGCTGLTEIVIPDSVTTIKGYAFKGCTGVTSVTLGDSVTTIGESAFHTCTSLKTIVIPESVTSIGDYCFSGSYNLWKITFEGDAPAIGTGAFKGLVATAYYPGGNSTWTSSVRLNYGGKITWKAA